MKFSAKKLKRSFKSSSNRASGVLKITSGKNRGLKIKTPATSITHPMGERERLALFNQLTARYDGSFENLNVLDLFAGSGALGFEAISRGATSVIFVDRDQKSADRISENIMSLGCESQATLIKSSVKTLLETWAAAQDETKKPLFDLILADPPYDNFDPADLSSVAKLLSDQGTFVLSHPDEAPELPNLTLLSTKKYARAHLSLYKKLN